jgi:exopolysaccharide biosynthesis polyprenyl glycosylphosphotransferase
MVGRPRLRVWVGLPIAAGGLGFLIWSTAQGSLTTGVETGFLRAGGLGILGLLLVLAWQRLKDARASVLVLGTSSIAAKLIEELESVGDRRFRLIGAVDDSNQAQPPRGVRPVLGRLDQFAEVVAATQPRHIVIAMLDRRGRLPERALLEARLKGVSVQEAVDFFERVTGKLAIEAMRPSALILSAGFGHAKPERSPIVRALRGCAGRACAFTALVVASPILALAAIAIKLDSPGPVFFVQKRVGRGGRPFGLLKLRTMSDDQVGSSEWVSDNTSRITRVGKWLRRFRLDELPQFVNVFRGDMNIVGPRPHPVSNYELFMRHIPYYEFRSLVRPGITGWAQVRYGYANGLEQETEKMRYDFYYIKHKSLLLDLRIILTTIGVLLFDRRSHQAAKIREVPGEIPGLNAAS